MFFTQALFKNIVNENATEKPQEKNFLMAGGKEARRYH